MWFFLYYAFPAAGTHAHTGTFVVPIDHYNLSVLKTFRFEWGLKGEVSLELLTPGDIQHRGESSDFSSAPSQSLPFHKLALGYREQTFSRVSLNRVILYYCIDIRFTFPCKLTMLCTLTQQVSTPCISTSQSSGSFRDSQLGAELNSYFLLSGSAEWLQLQRWDKV